MNVEFRDKTYRFERRISVQKLLDELKVNPARVLVARNGKLVTKEETLEPEDNVRIISVVSGG